MRFAEAADYANITGNCKSPWPPRANDRPLQGQGRLEMLRHEFAGRVSGAAIRPWAAAARPTMLFSGVCSVFFAFSVAHAQTAAPVFMPGLYETESRNSALPDQATTSRTCVASRDYDAFRDETIASYQKSSRFMNNCSLSAATPIKNGFTLAMQCKGTKAVLSYEFEKDVVRGTIETQIESAPQYSSSILIMMRRVGDCPPPDKPQ